MSVRLHAVGGLGFFGQNCMLVTDVDTGDTVVIDAGAGFPREAWAGSELSIPSPSVLSSHTGKIRGYVLTHGHQDHIGALPHFHKAAPAPVYGAPTTLALVHERCHDLSLPIPDLRELRPGATVALGALVVSALAVSHSIPDSLCILVEAGGVKLLHSGDFRVDKNPLQGPPTDMSGLSSLGTDGVDLLMADSTGALHTGHNPGERSVRPSLERVFSAATGRVFVTTFASHLQRIQMLAEVSVAHGRKMLLAGRGTLTHTKIARGLGNAPWSDAHVIHPSEAELLAPQRLTVVCSGCQGEERSAFWRLAHPDGRLPRVEQGDTIIHSARAIPGQERQLATLFDVFSKRGAHIHDAHDGVHVSGHGQREDLRALISSVRPRAVLPIHGGHRHMHGLALLAQEEGLDGEHTPVLGNGDVLQVARGMPPQVVDHREVPSALVDDDGQLVELDGLMAQRRALMAGLVVISVRLGRDGEVMGRPNLSVRGLGGAALELVRKEGLHEAMLSFSTLPAEERLDPETASASLERGVKRVFRRLRGHPPAVVAHTLTD